MDTNGDRTAAELVHLAERLRAERTVATPLELDELKQRARRQAAARNYRKQKGTWMKSRLALTAMIVAGLMLSTTGATLAISGNSGSGNAASQQYDQVEPNNNEEDAPVLGQLQGSGDSTGNSPASTGTQPVEQVAATGGDSSLPFTGFFTIPLMIAGVALLTIGGALRWKSRE
jgi:hypothetical protein